jgi:hypothetical protein
VPKLDEESILKLFRVESADFDLTTLDQPPQGMDYNDGSLLGDARTFLMGALMQDFLTTRPQLTSLVLWYPDAAYGDGVIIKTPFDRQFVEILDGLSVPARFRLKTCGLLIEELKAR